MAARKHLLDEPTPSTITQVRVIPPDAVFTLDELRSVLGLPRHTLRREARLGRLRVSRRAGKLWTTGAWVREWIETGRVRRQDNGDSCQTQV
jgi:hypothetical protein